MIARRDVLYASEMTMAKNFGRRKGGTLDLIRSNLSLNHCAGFERPGKMFICLDKDQRIVIPEQRGSEHT